MVDLDERIRKENIPETRELKPDEDITSRLESQTKAEGLEKKVDEDKFTLGRGIKDLVKWSPIAAAVYFVVRGTFTPLLTISGFIIGNLVEAKKKKENVSYKLMKRDITTATLLGATDYWFWTLPNIVPNLTLVGKLARTLFAVPVLAIPYLFGFNKFIYFRDELGLKGTVKSMFNGKFFYHWSKSAKYSKAQVKPQLKKLAPIYPTYFIGLNYMTNIYHRILLSVFNNFFLRFVVISKKYGPDEKKADDRPLLKKIRGFYKNIPKKLDNFFKHPDYKPAYGGAR